MPKLVLSYNFAGVAFRNDGSEYVGIRCDPSVTGERQLRRSFPDDRYRFYYTSYRALPIAYDHSQDSDLVEDQTYVLKKLQST